MKCIIVLMLAVSAAIGQTGTASISGTVLDSKTHRPIATALVTAIRNGVPPFSKNNQSGSDGAFQVQGLTAGDYTLCVQAQSAGYLDPCQWNGNPARVTLLAGQAAAGVSLGLTTASVLNIQVQDTQRILSQKTKDGRDPELSVGVWGPNGLYYPAHALDNPGAGKNSQTGIAYQIAIPRDISLRFHIASRDLKLGDALGANLPANANQEAFQHFTGELKPKSFAFTVLGLVP